MSTLKLLAVGGGALFLALLTTWMRLQWVEGQLETAREELQVCEALKLKSEIEDEVDDLDDDALLDGIVQPGGR